MATSGPIAAAFDAGTTLGLGPSELLGRFGATRDEAAFAALVEHHGPMVLATCRRILPDPSDADDAFQATFLVLARKARSIGDPDRLASWLHGVARRVSVKARARAARRRQVEENRPAADALPATVDDAIELRSILDEELARLPEKYRAPLVLCYLEGLTHDQAAGQLKWPVGTVRSRLAGGRDRLRSSLARRGFAPSALATLSPATLPSAAVSHLLRAATVRLAFTPILGTVATPAALLAQGVLTSMLVTKLQVLGLAAATTLALGTAGLVAASPQFGGAGPGTPAQVPPAAEPKPADPPKPAAPALDQPTPAPPAVDLAKELDSARARIKALEAELAALKAKPQGGMGTGMAMRSSGTPSGGQAAAPTPGPGAMMGGGMGSGGGGGMGMGFSGPNGAGGMGMGFSGANGVGGVGGMGGGVGGGGGMGGGINGRPGGSGYIRPGNSAGRPTLLGNGKVLIGSPEGNRIMAVDTNTGIKDTFRPTGEVTGIGLVYSAGVVGLFLQGPRITQVAAYSLQGDRWYPVDLREPVVAGQAPPVVGADYVQYHFGRFLYLFSARAKRWGVLELKQPLQPADPYTARDASANWSMNSDSMLVNEGDALHVFNFATGEWSHIDTKDESTVQPVTEPADPKLPK